MKSNNRFIVALFLILSSPAVMGAVWTIVYPQSEVDNDERYEFPLALLELSLQKTGVRYQLVPSSSPITQAKSIKRLEENLEINVLWSMTDLQRESQLRAIRIPITKGLIGWRVLLTHKDNPFLFTKIDSQADLLKFSPVQGIAWPDTKILQANGFNVITARDYIEATQSVNFQEADFFPRSVIEVMSELENTYSKNFRLKKNILIRYPAAQYFFTNKSNVTLANLLKTGMQRAIADGSYDELFMKHYGEVLERFNVEGADVYYLSNPLLPVLTPIEDKSLWYKPNALP
ncbi:amino acid ABC transporter substrate-binding protein [Glaciecola petra]|uniref:Amino acid ABC transporter substrate-binding protein n=1 Tax=Glaciecola petra TaxID=3075602 RepID=A0ABU2ZMS3_9ALTE|nr:amino acid ABC transporter substrate-binding protein [Aestuariibacter sp. P117]MDT0593927.1 amino acid ABC transporter substrate-binding protein [Aestuariibacter sp. P117]